MTVCWLALCVSVHSVSGGSVFLCVLIVHVDLCFCVSDECVDFSASVDPLSLSV